MKTPAVRLRGNPVSLLQCSSSFLLQALAKSYQLVDNQGKEATKLVANDSAVCLETKVQNVTKGASRIGAAIDAMTPFGYPKEDVRAKVKNLLKVYGGDAGYPFIEADSYKVLIEAFLEDEDNKREKTSMKTPNTGGPSTSIVSACSHTPNTVQIDREEELTYSPIPHSGSPPSPPLIATASPPSPPPQSIPAQRRNPCYGYIDGEDEDEETDFVILTPIVKRSRWDVRPEDM